MKNMCEKFLVLVVLLLLAGTSGAETKIRMAGSGSMIPLINDLAKAFMADNKAVVIEINQKSIESTGGIMSAGEGKVDIGMTARPLKEDEKHLGLQPVEIARVATVIGVNKNVTLKAITSEQLCGIYSGKITNWQELGGGKEPIMTLTRPDRDATKDTIRKNIACFKDLKEPTSVVTMATAPEMARVLANRPNAIGLIDSVAVDESAGAITALKVDGVDPSPDNVRTAKYKILKSNILVTKGAPAGAVKDFLSFIKSPKGSKIIESHKAVPVK